MLVEEATTVRSVARPKLPAVAGQQTAQLRTEPIGVQLRPQVHRDHLVLADPTE
jgi:hypothetical protein